MLSRSIKKYPSWQFQSIRGGGGGLAGVFPNFRPLADLISAAKSSAAELSKRLKDIYALYKNNQLSKLSLGQQVTLTLHKHC